MANDQLMDTNPQQVTSSHPLTAQLQYRNRLFGKRPQPYCIIVWNRPGPVLHLYGDRSIAYTGIIKIIEV